jgi:hypothetical protein
MFGSEDDAPEPLSSIVDSDDREDTDDDFIDPDDPIPQVFPAGLAAEDEGGMSKLMIALFGFIVFILATPAALYFASGPIGDALPFMKPVYEALGVNSGGLGEGLTIFKVKSVRETEGDIDVLDVRGNIVNNEDDTVDVPNVLIVLSDESNEVVMEFVTAPQSTVLEGEAKTRFKARLVDVPATARRMEVIWTVAVPTPIEEPKKGDAEMKQEDSGDTEMKEEDDGDTEMKEEDDEPAASDGRSPEDKPAEDESAESDEEAPAATGVKPAMSEEQKDE